jgi:hypothetical protein
MEQLAQSIVPSPWEKIIGAAASSPLGIVALCLLVVAAFFRPRDPAWLRLLVTFVLLLFAGSFAVFAIYHTTPTTLTAPTPASSPTGHTMQPGTSDIPTGAASPNCNAEWSGWVDIGGAVGNPCPAGCSRGGELGQSYRVVGLPPRPQTKHKFECRPE